MSLLETGIDDYNKGVEERITFLEDYQNAFNDETEIRNVQNPVEEDHNIDISSNNSERPIILALDNMDKTDNAPEVEDINEENPFDIFDQQRFPEIEENFFEYLEMS